MVRADFAAFIITYNRPQILQDTIGLVAEQSVAPALILVVNNGLPVPNLIDNCKLGIKIEEIVMQSNSGPSGAATIALKMLYSRGFKWIQWIDDDDPPKKPDLNKLLFDHLEKLNILNIGIIAPVGSYFNTRKGVTKRVGDADILNNNYLQVQTIGGNQCMLINSEVVAAGCLPTPELFFGFEETNFCLKVLNAGYDIIVPCDLFREYRTLAARWNLTNSAVRKVRIPAWRSYYSVRNLVYMFRFEFKKPSTVFQIILRLGMKAVYDLRRPSDGFLRLFYTILGIRDGLTKRLGLTVKPLAKH